MKLTNVAAVDGYPLPTPLAGYFPGRMLRVIGEVPVRLMQRWRLWCLDPDYPFGVMPTTVREHRAALKLRLLSLSFTDDEYRSERSIQHH
jgi:predicted alpha/beta hydrolase